MKRYETPEFKAVHYEIENGIMDGYNPGNIGDNPWADLFKPAPSGNEESAAALTLD